MKRFILTLLAAVTLLAAPQVRAWTYADGDLLLIFRNGSQDVEFDVGSVTNFLGKTNGYTTTVTGWDPTLVTSTFGSFTGVKVVFIATGGPTNWLSSAEPNTTAYSISSPAANTLHGVINAVGTKTLYPIAIPTAEANAYSIDAGGQYAASSYDYVVSGGNKNGIAKLGGNAPFTVEQSVPGFLDFWSVAPTTVYPNSPPDHLVGTFTINAIGVLTFVAGPRAATIYSVNHASSLSTVQFTTTVGNIYSLAYTNALGSAVTNWPIDATTVVGDGRIDTINHAATDSAEFYKIKTQ
jgi:hypothetical protein